MEPRPEIEKIDEVKESFIEEFSDKLLQQGVHLAYAKFDEDNCLEARIFSDKRLRKWQKKAIDEMLPETLVYRDLGWQYSSPSVSMAERQLVPQYKEVEIPVKLRYDMVFPASD
ncbi:MAG: hypothetical protein ACLFTR_02575 [Candidatus Woesearchaeota archaeon]